MTQELEILRGELIRILYDLTKADVEYRFEEHIIQLEQTEANMNVTFSNGRSEIFDLVIAAEGIGSKTRELAFPKRPDLNSLGIYRLSDHYQISYGQ